MYRIYMLERKYVVKIENETILYMLKRKRKENIFYVYRNNGHFM